MTVFLTLLWWVVLLFGAIIALIFLIATPLILRERWQRRRAERELQRLAALVPVRFAALPSQHREVLAGLLDVPWPTLECTWGKGTLLPLWLMWLQADCFDEDNCSSFDGEMLVHQYTAWTAAPACAPFLVRIATSPIARHRLEAMDALYWLTSTWNSSPTAAVMVDITECLRAARPSLAAICEPEPELEELRSELIPCIDALVSRTPQRYDVGLPEHK